MGAHVFPKVILKGTTSVWARPLAGLILDWQVGKITNFEMEMEMEIFHSLTTNLKFDNGLFAKCCSASPVFFGLIGTLFCSFLFYGLLYFL